MLFRARAARDLPVCDVSDQSVPKRILRLARDRCLTLALGKLSAYEPVQRPLDRVTVGAGKVSDAARPEHLAENGGVLEEVLL
jgi:hypothetical protein